MEFNVCPQGHKLPSYWVGLCLYCDSLKLLRLWPLLTKPEWFDEKAKV